VIVADNSLMVEAISLGFRKSGEFNLVGYADAHRTSPERVLGVEPDVILVDDMYQSQRAVELTRQLADRNQQVAIIVLSVEMDREWLQEISDAGATWVISKATHPVALATLVREMLDGHICHTHNHLRGNSSAGRARIAEASPLTSREVEILELVASGCTNGEVAGHLWVTEQTVKFHLRNIYRKLGVANRTQASRFAYVNGLVGADPDCGLGADTAVRADPDRGLGADMALAAAS
jgi:DNA-binding NarL/FixJ family response regulator